MKRRLAGGKNSVRAVIFCAACFVFYLGITSELASAANQDEIQVYDDSINKPGEFGLELHLNGTPAGRTFLNYPGEITNEHGFRFTPEFSYGLTRDIELGLYLDTEIDGQGTAYFVGPKYRLKWIPFRSEENNGWFAGANWEYSTVSRRFLQAMDELELRTIFGYKTENWIFVANPVFDWDVGGGIASSNPEFTASFKFTHKVVEGLAAGIEYYGDLGRLSHFAPLDQQDRRLYLVADVDLKPWSFNIGVGRGFTGQADAWTVKAIIEVPVEDLFKKPELRR